MSKQHSKMLSTKNYVAVNYRSEKFWHHLKKYQVLFEIWVKVDDTPSPREKKWREFVLFLKFQ